MSTGLILLAAGLLLVLWGADRFADGALGTATRFGLSAFWVGAVVSGFEPENLATGGAAALGHLPQIALGTVIGSTVFMLTAGLGLALLVAPMEVRVPRAGALAMLASLAVFVGALGNDGTVGRLEGLVLVLVSVALMAWLYRASAIPPRAQEAGDRDEAPAAAKARAVALVLGGVAVLLAGAELVVEGVRALLASVRLSETFLGMAVVGMGESLEEAARMVAPARRGHPELAWGNVVGTTIVLLTFNLGAIALVRPLSADPLVLRFHAPYLALCVLLVAAGLLGARRLGRGAGLLLLGLYALYLAVNLTEMWR